MRDSTVLYLKSKEWPYVNGVWMEEGSKQAMKAKWRGAT